MPPLEPAQGCSVLRYIGHSGVGVCAALIPASEIASAVAALLSAGLRGLLSPTTAAPTPPMIVPSTTEKATMRTSRRKRVVRRKPPNSGWIYRGKADTPRVIAQTLTSRNCSCFPSATGCRSSAEPRKLTAGPLHGISGPNEFEVLGEFVSVTAVSMPVSESSPPHRRSSPPSPQRMSLLSSPC